MDNVINNRKTFKTPFCKEYWRLAAAELKDLRMLTFAALIIAIRVALKFVKIPIAPSIDINTAFIANAFGAMIYGPVVAIPSAFVSDFLGWVLQPKDPYFILFALTEISGSVIFALFFYRAEVTVTRITLSRFCICFFVNVLMSEPIFILYYKYIKPMPYTPFQILRMVKNLVMFPIESVVLTVIFRHLIPPFQRQGYLKATADKLKFTKKHIAILTILVLIGTGATIAYLADYYNTKSISASYSEEERLKKNTAMNEWVTEEYPDIDHSGQVTIIESAKSTIFNTEVNYVLAVYRIDAEKFAEKAINNQDYTLEAINGYSKSPALKDDALIPIGKGTAVMNKFTGSRISIDIDWIDDQSEKENE